MIKDYTLLLCHPTAIQSTTITTTKTTTITMIKGDTLLLSHPAAIQTISRTKNNNNNTDTRQFMFLLLLCMAVRRRSKNYRLQSQLLSFKAILFTPSYKCKAAWKNTTSHHNIRTTGNLYTSVGVVKDLGELCLSTIISRLGPTYTYSQVLKRGSQI